ncbi:MAG: universal stress protein [Acidimicrobiia bacterium]|jgi:nucleotide-binding universal stress UspA family protein
MSETPQPAESDRTTTRSLDEGSLLVGVDSSESAQHALSWTGALAERAGGKVTLVHASSPWTGLDIAILPFDYEGYHKDVERAVDEWAGTLHSVAHETRTLEDAPAEALLTIADETSPSLLVLGAHARGRWKRHVLGSVTSKVLQATTHPTAVIPRSAPADAAGTSLLVGLDGSPSSLRALRWAALSAASLGATVYAVCVVSLDGFAERPRLAESDSGDPVGDTLEALRSLATQVAAETGATITSDVLVGHPAECLVSAAEDRFALVVGKTGYSPFKDTALGSTSRTCATHAAVPVIVIP